MSSTPYVRYKNTFQIKPHFRHDPYLYITGINTCKIAASKETRKLSVQLLNLEEKGSQISFKNTSCCQDYTLGKVVSDSEVKEDRGRRGVKWGGQTFGLWTTLGK